MDDEYKIKSITPSIAGWWLECQDEEGNTWFQPIVAWANCRILNNGSEYVTTYIDFEGLFPMVDGGEGAIVPYITGDAGIRYLPDAKFKPSSEPSSSAYYPVNEE
ncbi:hypothetical protein V1956_23885 [Yersinia sp. 2540 StPb PI]|uniref:hypothetical protein n=1 Tax=Yersinia sp. 2540 StPb PI TaxID=3117406 RepID=UPI003FA49990